MCQYHKWQRSVLLVSLGLTKDEPNETTLLSLLKAMLPTAFAMGTPFYHTESEKRSSIITDDYSYNLLPHERMLSHVIREAGPEPHSLRVYAEARLDKGHGRVLQVELSPS